MVARPSLQTVLVTLGVVLPLGHELEYHGADVLACGNLSARGLEAFDRVRMDSPYVVAADGDEGERTSGSGESR